MKQYQRKIYMNLAESSMIFRTSYGIPRFQWKDSKEDLCGRIFLKDRKIPSVKRYSKNTSYEYYFYHDYFQYAKNQEKDAHN